MKRAGLVRRGQEGMASMVVVTILAVVITMISLGFARIMNRAITSSANRQAGNSATYAAESGINDVAAYIKAYATAHPNQPQPSSSNCSGTNSLIGSQGSPGPFYDDSNLSGDSTTKYSCILLNETPVDVNYQDVPSNASQVVKLTTSANQYSLDKIMISWQPTSSSSAINFPATSATSANALKDESTWNSNANNFLPMLRVTLYPIPQGDSIANVQDNSKTIFLYPEASSGNVPVLHYDSLVDGSFQPVHCNTTLAAGSFTGSADYKCNVIINNLTLATTQPSVDKTDFFYARIMPIYNNADIKLKANDQWGQSVKFVNVQAVVDVTAQSASVVKRLQARLDISCLVSQPCDNLQPTDYSAPEYTVRSANAICKRLLEYSSYYNYAQVDGPTAICNQLSNEIYTPAPTLAFSVVGNDGKDNGTRVCSAGDVPEKNSWGCTTADNPDSPQTPQQTATVFINSKASVNWVSTDSAISCIASGGWSGDKNPQSSWSGYTGTGSQAFTGISNYTSYSLVCKGPGGTTPTKTVHAWPPPKVNFNGSSSSYNAGNSYTIKWNSNSATSCTISSSGNKAWNQTYNGLNPAGDTRSQTFGTSWNDNNTKTYHIVCVDPIGRSTSADWKVSTDGGGTTIYPPSCSASVSHSNGTGSGTYSWSGSCPEVSPGSGYYQLVNCQNISCGWVGSSGSGSTGTGSFCIELQAGADPWGWLADSGRQCWTIHPKMSLSYFQHGSVVDEGPTECDSSTGWYNRWWCRNNAFVYNPGPCSVADGGNHRWILCSDSGPGNGTPHPMKYDVEAGSENGSVSCRVTATNYGDGTWYSGGHQGSTGGPDGWGDGGAPNFRLYCTNSASGESNNWDSPNGQY